MTENDMISESPLQPPGNRGSSRRLGVSTGFASEGCGSAERLMAAIEAVGAGAVELDYRLKADLLQNLIPLLKSANIPVTSIHNFCPVPPVPPKSAGGGDLFSLADPNPEIRREAIRWTTRTLQKAHELEAGVVVLHCGAVVFNHEETDLFNFFAQGQIRSEAACAFIDRKLAELDRVKPPFMDSLFFSLDRLIREAERYGVILGIENRYHYYELPGSEDFMTLFREFGGAPLGYWHDTGHAHVSEILSISTGQAMLQGLEEYLVGFHVHDASGLEDHLPPGEGDIDFQGIARWVKKDTRLVLELKPGTEIRSVAGGLALLERIETESADTGR